MTLEGQARRFAGTLSEALNGSITHGIRLKALLSRDGGIGWMGYLLTKVDLVGRPIPLTISQAPPHSFPDVAQILALEEESRYLVTQSAVVALYLDGDGKSPIFRYDYNREPDNPYPSIHLQVEGESAALHTLNKRRGQVKALGDLHFPVGGRRFRPCLDDVIEFLIVEGYANAREGWEAALETTRSRFHRTQLMAAVRNDPEAAKEQLGRMSAEAQRGPGASDR